jgi:hypothetical protein
MLKTAIGESSTSARSNRKQAWVSMAAENLVRIVSMTGLETGLD